MYHKFSQKLSIVEKNAYNKKCISRWGLQVIFGTFCEILHIGWDKRKQPWFWSLAVYFFKSHFSRKIMVLGQKYLED